MNTRHGGASPGIPVRRRVGTLARLPVGLILVSWRYLWRITALHRSEEEGDHTDLPPPLPEGSIDARSKALDDGAGPMFHRRFSVRIAGSPMAPAELVDAIAANLNAAAPSEAAVFHKTLGVDGTLAVADEYLVQMPGPWDGPVRVVHRDATSFRFGTLAGHLEAGHPIQCAPRRSAVALRNRGVVARGRPLRQPALHQAPPGQGDSAQHVGALLSAGSHHRLRSVAGRGHHPHPQHPRRRWP